MPRSWICMAVELESAPAGRNRPTATWRLSRSLRGRNVFFGLLGAFTEEIGFHLLHDELLVIFLPGLKAVFVEQHLHVLLPLLPCKLGDLVVDALSQFAIEGRLVEAFHLASHLDALH